MKIKDISDKQMISINEFLTEKGIPSNQSDFKIDKENVEKYIKDYAILVREEQILYCALGAAHHTSINVRHVPQRLDDDLRDHMNVCRVEVS